MVVSKEQLKAYSMLIACCGLIFYGSSQPAKDIANYFPFQDVVFHGIVYMILGWSFARVLNCTVKGIDFLRCIVYTAVFGLIFGVSDEFHQFFVPGRIVSGIDINIDTISAFIGGILFRWLK